VRGRIAERLKAAATNSFAAADTARLTEARYKGGVDSSLANLDAQRSLYAARRAEVAVKLADLRNRIALYRTLGGDSVAEVAPAPTPAK
jgi:multidrug efflux system outer membrane protein